jgi:DNA replication licensing factor MCM3
VLKGERIRQMRDRGEQRVVVDLDALRRWNAPFTSHMLRHAQDYLPDMTEALREYVASSSVFDAKVVSQQADDGDGGAAMGDGTDAVSSVAKWTLGFTGSFGVNHVNPRALRSAHLWRLIRVEGMVTKCSTIHPRLLRSVHYCEKTGEVITRTYPTDETASGMSGAVAAATYPTKDAAGNPLTTEYGECLYRDHQTAVVQEMPEHAPAGQLPCSVGIVLEDDLVDRIKPGDRVQVAGVYVALPHVR